ncbi:MAG: Ku protein [Firmicutes bacterium]|jgi:DNA end-binding protein Ku|nr:Ku protein [Bacillota bacterium]NLL88505.1 Ku protein [Bacillota bacterium]
MRSLWSGAISFGLVNIPVKLYAATERQDLKFNYLHRKCHTPIRYQKFCPTCETEVAQDEIVRGFEYAKGQYVVLTEADFAGVAVEATKTIDIIDFVNLADIDPIYFDKTYYLEPVKPGVKAYQLLRLAMEQTGKIALARVVIRTKQVMAAIRIYQDLMAMETMFYPAEIRSAHELAKPEDVQIGTREMEMAVALINSQTAPFDPSQYENTYRKALVDLIDAKIAGDQDVVAAKPQEKGRIIDLVAALEASLKAAEQQAESKREKEHVVS